MLGEETDTAWMPDWYPSMQAAKYLGVPWWDLVQQSVYYQDKALIAMAAEAEARKILEQRQ